MPDKRTWFEIRAAAQEGDVEVFIYDYIGKSWWNDRAMDAKKLIDSLAEVKDRHVAVHINSLGGDAFEGQAIHNALRRHPGGTTAYIDGVCASAATFAALGCDKVVMAANALFMIHKAWTIELGSADDMRKIANTLDKVDATQVSVYHERTGIPKDELLEAMGEESWYTAEEALEKGFADQVGDEVEVAALARDRRDIAAHGIRNLPDKVAAMLVPADEPEDSRIDALEARLSAVEATASQPQADSGDTAPKVDNKEVAHALCARFE